jgi:hypothetical protein
MSDQKLNLFADDERLLRDLLERAVPHLSAPAQRMAAVRRRIVRRRRARAAGLVLGAITAAAITFATVPADQQDADRTAVAAPPEGRGPVLILDKAPGVHFGDGRGGHGLALALPEGWFARPGADGGGPVGHASDHPLGPAPECENEWSPAFTCAPADRLPLGGTLVEFEVLTPTSDELEITDTLELRDLSPSLNPTCWERGGVSEFVSTVVKVSDRSSVRASVCLAPRTKGDETAEPGADVRALLASARLVVFDMPWTGLDDRTGATADPGRSPAAASAGGGDLPLHHLMPS